MSKSSSAQSFPALSRRGFLAAGGAGVVGLTLSEALAARAASGGSAIQIVLTGGASHLETFDPKPHAPREIRGPLHSIATKIPGVRFSECLPRLAERADQLVVLRSLFHEAAPIHATGLQLLLTGGLVKKGIRLPHIGFVLKELLSNRRAPVAVELGGTVRSIGTAASSGDSSGCLTSGDESASLPGLNDLALPATSRPDFSQAPRRIRDAYGENHFGELFWTAARLVESGVRYVAVNTFSELEGKLTWDAHGFPGVGPATIFDYGNLLGPQFDKALAALFDDLHQTGLWKQTLVAATGEMGRSPKVNEAGGRDHWTQAWSGLLAGGMLQAGQVIGETDEHGETILDHPLEITRIPAMILEFLGIAPGTEIVLQDGCKLHTPAAPAIFS
ncbi:DUF1501 domain-containing protein [Planctomicrobium sp. SH661]|uniref:DUF1501 domain-containing protein n=1 Tax=Planctomicrobium sp. SH661 TaxID=3448124 RepID=UPI003F5C2E52